MLVTIQLIKVSDKVVTSVRSRRRLLQLIISESESSDSKSDDINDKTNIRDDWTTTNISLSLEVFKGDPDVRVTPNDNGNTEEVISTIFGDNFFETLCDETNNYSHQTSSKYKVSPKPGKWTCVKRQKSPWELCHSCCK
jgi:hypothetical protein